MGRFEGDLKEKGLKPKNPFKHPSFLVLKET